MIKHSLLVSAVLLLCNLIVTPSARAQSSEELISSATESLPENLKRGASVVYWSQDGTREVLREGNNGIICQTDSPAPFYLAGCQHESWQPLMMRMIGLQSQGMAIGKALAVVNQELESSDLTPPDIGALFSFASGPDSTDIDITLGIFMGDATGESTGLPTEPSTVGPWLMCSGTPQAHIMLGEPPYVYRQANVSLNELCGL